MTITTFQQTTLPDVGVRVTEISQDIIVWNFHPWYDECCSIIKENNYEITFNAWRQLKEYYKADLTPTQAVKKYFL